MSCRLTTLCLTLGLACAGTLGGCSDDSTAVAPRKDASSDSPASLPPDQDAAADVNPVADAKSGPDAGTGKTDAPLEDANVARADVASDLVDRRDGAADMTEWKDTPPPDSPADAGERKDTQPSPDSPADAGERKDAPPSPDSPADAAVAPDSKAIDAPPALDVAKREDAPPTADGNPGIDSNLSPLCKSILLDNTGLPVTYPVLYREPTNAGDTFASRTATLLSSYGLTDADYTFEHTPIAWAATLKQGMGPCTLTVGGPLTTATYLATVRSFLSKWGDLFLYKDNAKELVAASCDSKLCLVTLAQDYCGLKVSSQEQIYRGDAYVDMYPKDGCVWQAVSHFVPMVQVPRNMLLSEAQIKQAIVGLTLKYACATGERTVQVSAEDTFFMPDAPSVFVSQSQTQPGIELEYRMALPVVVDTGLPWTIYVDGMDGTVLRSVAGFICD